MPNKELEMSNDLKTITLCVSLLVILALVVMGLIWWQPVMSSITLILITWKFVNKAKTELTELDKIKNVLIIDLIIKDSVDEMIISALKNKIKLSAKTLGEEAKKWLS
jgi:hypothetical protein